MYSLVGGDYSPASMYPRWRNFLTQRAPVHSPLFIDLDCSYDSLTNAGTVTALVTSDSTSNVSGNIYFAVVENSIPYNWGGGLTTVEHVCRDMLPSGSGTAVTVPAGDTIIREQSFSINTAWNENNVYIVVWVQDVSTRLIYQAALTRIQPKPDMEYAGLTYTEVSGNNDRVAEPGETITMYVNAKNNGGGSYTGSATITTSDAYITINSSAPQATAITAGNVDTVLAVECAISSSCPIDHIAEFLVDFGSPGDTSRARLMITDNPGIEDDIESGQGGWTHTGSNDQWHISTYRSHSPTHSWYNGNDGSHTYPNSQTASLVSPYFVVTPDSGVTFWHYYNTAAWDYGYFEIDNNCGWWRQLGSYVGTQTSWNQVSIPLTEYAGQTVRFRYRFYSTGSTASEGWYIDDLRVPMVFGIEENLDAGVKPYALTLAPNPFSRSIDIRYTIQDAGSEINIIKIYDASGRLVKSLNPGLCIMNHESSVTWSGDDDDGNQLPSGTYFVEISGENGTATEKALLLK